MADKKLFLGVSAVALKSSGRGEFPELVPDHVFRYVDRDEAFTVMNTQVQTNEVGRDRGTPRPSLNRSAVIGLLGLLNLIHEAGIDEETFFN